MYLLPIFSGFLFLKHFSLVLFFKSSFFMLLHIPCKGHSESESRSVVSDSLRPCGLYSPWNSPGQNSGVGSLSFLQGIRHELSKITVVVGDLRKKDMCSFFFFF